MGLILGPWAHHKNEIKNRTKIRQVAMINMGLKHNAITTRIKYDKTKIRQQKFKIKIRTIIKYDIKI